MAQPYNYMLNPTSPAQGFGQALKMVKGVDEINASRLAAKNAAEDRAAAIAENQRVAQENERYQQEILKLGDNPRSDDIARMILRFPTQSAPLKQVHSMLSESEKKATNERMNRIAATIDAGAIDQTQKLIADYAEGFRNAGQEDQAKMYKDLGKLIEVNPAAGNVVAASYLGANLTPEELDKRITRMKEQGRADVMQGPELTKKQAEAKMAAIKSNFAESNAAADLEKKGWEIRKLDEDIRINRRNVEIAALKAEEAKTSNELKRQELQQKIKAAEVKRDQTVRERAAEISNARANIDNMLDTISRVVQTPENVMGAVMGPFDQTTPTVFKASADFEALVENLNAQAFIAQVPSLKGMGALSDAEGKKVTAALQSFSLKQSPEQLLKNLDIARRLLMKSRSTLAEKYGVPETVPDTPSVIVTDEELREILNRRGGGQ